MKVRELLAALQGADPDLDVVVSAGEYGFTDLSEARVRTVAERTNDTYGIGYLIEVPNPYEQLAPGTEHKVFAIGHG